MHIHETIQFVIISKTSKPLGRLVVVRSSIIGVDIPSVYFGYLHNLPI